MKKNKTTSDKLKNIFAKFGGGSEKDWKRLSKKNNAQSQPVRIFENKKTGVMVEVVEVGPDHFLARQLNAAAMPASAKSNTADYILEPTIETDPAQNSAADRILQKLDNRHKNNDDESEGLYGVSQTLMTEAGTALANRFTFAIGRGGDIGDDDALFAEISPRGIGPYCDHVEPFIAHLLPSNGGEVMELTFDFSNYTDPARLVSDLLQRGFIWNPQYQNEMAPDMMQELQMFKKDKPEVKGAAPAPKG